MPRENMNSGLEKLVAQRSNVMINHYNDDLSEVPVGIVFLYAVWSQSVFQLHHLLQSLESYPRIPLYIFDVDVDGSFEFFVENGFASHGWGETYWIKGGVIIASMDKYLEKEREQLLSNHKLFI